MLSNWRQTSRIVSPTHHLGELRPSYDTVQVKTTGQRIQRVKDTTELHPTSTFTPGNVLTVTAERSSQLQVVSSQQPVPWTGAIRALRETMESTSRLSHW